MFKKIAVATLLILIGFTAGLGASFWEKVETVNIVFYSGMVMLTFSGAFLFGFELWQHIRTYRRAVAQQFDNFSKVSAIPVRTPALPRLEELHPQAKTLDAIEALFSPVES